MLLNTSLSLAMYVCVSECVGCGNAVPVVAELAVGRFLGRRRARAAAVLDLVVTLDQVLELVRRVERGSSASRRRGR